jgi:hypothetical protein
MENTSNRILEVAHMPRSRRNFLKGVSVGLAALVATTAINHRTAGQAFAREVLQGDLTDIDILNFALTLEYLEGTFYTLAVNSGVLSGTALSYATTLRDHEEAHVVALTDAITAFGGTPEPRPGADAYNFGDMSTEAAILATAQTLEETGVGAYTGAAALIQDKQNVLPAAASIEQVEARHAAAIRLLRGNPPAPGPYGPVLTVPEVQNAIAPIVRG